jgi:hypothetical protein
MLKRNFLGYGELFTGLLQGGSLLVFSSREPKPLFHNCTSGGLFVLETGLRKSSELSKVLVLLVNIPLVLLTSVGCL